MHPVRGISSGATWGEDERRDADRGGEERGRVVVDVAQEWGGCARTTEAEMEGRGGGGAEHP